MTQQEFKEVCFDKGMVIREYEDYQAARNGNLELMLTEEGTAYQREPGGSWELLQGEPQEFLDEECCLGVYSW